MADRRETDVSLVVLLTADLLFGSKIEAMARTAGAVVALTAHPDEALVSSRDAALLLVDLTADSFDGATVVARGSTPTAGFYAHTDDETRQRALDAGFTLVAPRSRWMREGPDLIRGLIS